MASPNLLFLFTDQQRADTLAAYGNAQIEMPNLNRLAEQSVVFEDAYDSQPVCTPARGTLLTGLYPHTHGCVSNNIALRAETPCLPEMLPRGRWASGYFGKWHLGDEIFRQHGFDEWLSVEDMYAGHFGEGRDPAARSDYHRFLLESGFTPQEGNRFSRYQAAHLPEANSKPAFLAREAGRFIRRNAARPFALYVNFLEPHTPYHSPRDGQYDRSRIPLPANFSYPPTADQPLKARLLHEYYALHGADAEAQWRDVIARYWGLCSLVDTHVGAILRTLEECGLMENTIIVYTSDHGDMMGSHQMLAKGVAYQEAVRVPLMVRLPGHGRGRRVAGPASHIDVVPTLLDLMGQAMPGHLQGRSLRPELEGRSIRVTRDAFIEWNGSDFVKPVRKLYEELATRGEKPASGDVPLDEAVAAACAPTRTVVATEGWKLTLDSRGEHELYDLNMDAGETRNRVRDASQRARISDLSGRIRQWQGRTGDTVRLPEP